MKSLKARIAEREDRKEREERIAARTALANRGDAGFDGEVRPAELDPQDAPTGDQGSENDGSGEDAPAGNKKPKGAAANWTPNA